MAAPDAEEAPEALGSLTAAAVAAPVPPDGAPVGFFLLGFDSLLVADACVVSAPGTLFVTNPTKSP